MDFSFDSFMTKLSDVCYWIDYSIAQLPSSIKEWINSAFRSQLNHIDEFLDEQGKTISLLFWLYPFCKIILIGLNEHVEEVKDIEEPSEVELIPVELQEEVKRSNDVNDEEISNLASEITQVEVEETIGKQTNRIVNRVKDCIVDLMSKNKALQDENDRLKKVQSEERLTIDTL